MGQVLLCDYSTGFKEPEMVKRRPAVVVSPRLRYRDRLCTVVPLSGTAPVKQQDYHCCIKMTPMLPTPWDSPAYWVKADLIATVSFQRLDLIRGPKGFQGKRKYINHKLSMEDLMRIRRCILHALGFSSLTNHLDGAI